MFTHCAIYGHPRSTEIIFVPENGYLTLLLARISPLAATHKLLQVTGAENIVHRTSLGKTNKELGKLHFIIKCQHLFDSSSLTLIHIVSLSLVYYKNISLEN